MATEFPAFIKLEYRPNPSAESRFVAEVDNTLGTAERRFRTFSTEAQRQLGIAMTVPRNDLGALNLGADEARSSARAQQAKAIAAREVAIATATAAREAGDYSQQARLAAAATEALALEEEQAARAALAHADAVEQVQRVLNRQASSTDFIVGATGRMTAANDNARFGLQNLGYQLGDISTMWALGARPMQIFASQSGQVIQAVTMMTGGTGRLAGFLGGPWGIALTTAALAVTPLIGKLLEAEDATNKVEFAGYALGDAQSILGEVMDLTTGKINTQSEALLNLARSKAIAAEVDARRERAAAESEMADIQRYRPRVTGGMGGGLSLTRARGVEADIVEAFREGSMSQTEAVRGLRSLGDTALITEGAMIRALAAVNNFAMSDLNIERFQQLQEVLDGDNSHVGQFLKPDHSSRKAGGDRAKELERLESLGERAAEKIAQINAQFDDQPKLIDQATQGIRTLDRTIADLRKQLGGEGLTRAMRADFTASIDAAEEALSAIQDALVRPVDELRENSANRLKLQEMLLAGYDEEAAALQAVLSLEDKLGGEEGLRAKAQELITQGRTEEATALQQLLSLYPDLKRQVASVAAEEQRRTEEMRIQQELLGNYLSATQAIRGELEAMFRGDGSIGGFRDVFKDLQSKVLTENIFGDALRDLDDAVKGRTGVVSANDFLADQTMFAGNAAIDFANKVNTATATIGNPAASSGFEQAFSGNWLGSTGKDEFTAGDGVNQIVVARNIEQAIRRGPMGMTPETYAAMLSDTLSGTIVRVLNEILGIDFFNGLQNVLSRSFNGYLTAGLPGLGLGIVEGLNNRFGMGLFGEEGAKAFSEDIAAALKGAQTGTQIAALADSFGLGLSNMGSQLGGAIGQFAGEELLTKALGSAAGPLGAIAGSLLGGIFGNFIGGADRGSAIISGGKVSGYYGDTEEFKQQSGQLAGGILQSLSRIADQFGATLDAALGKVSIGIRDGEYYVDPQGRGYTKQSKYPDIKGFGEDAKAAERGAIIDLINDGVIAGLRQGTLNLIKAGTDLDAQLQKAMDFEDVFKRLEAYQDPAGAALRGLNKEFERLADVFAEAGASTAELAQLEELYAIERREIIERESERLTSSLKGLLHDLTIGNDSLSLREREQLARAAYEPLAARVQAGDSTAYDGFAQAARELLDIEREIYGSQEPYFQLLAEVTNLTKSALAAQEAAVAQLAANPADPLSGSTQAASDNQGVVDAVNAMSSTISGAVVGELRAVNANLGKVYGALTAKSGSGGGVYAYGAGQTSW